MPAMKKGNQIMEPIKTAIVTGASRGIGATIAERLAHDGFAIVINYAGNLKAAEETIRKIEAAGGKAISVKADVADPTAVKTLFDTAEKTFGGIDIVVNNAGILIKKPLVLLTDADFDALVSINLKGTFNIMREAGTRVRRGGRIINLSSSLATLRAPSYSVYSGTKAAVEAMTTTFARELIGKNITVNAVAPGPTATDLYLSSSDQEEIEKTIQSTPLERLGEPKDIADVVAFLAGPDGGWINGQTLRANGGII